MNRTSTFIISILFLIIFAFIADGRMNRVNQIPNGSKYNCQNCHISPNGGGSLTPFGVDVNNNLSGSNVNWGPALANLDSDNDGFTNGQELLDPAGSWKSGSPNPGSTDNIGNPGDNKSIPVISSIVDMIETQISVSPNPVQASANLNFFASKELIAAISIISMTGETLSTFHNGIIPAGQFSINFNTIDFSGNKLSSGIYLIVISSENQKISKKIVVQ